MPLRRMMMRITSIKLIVNSLNDQTILTQPEQPVGDIISALLTTRDVVAVN